MPVGRHPSRAAPTSLLPQSVLIMSKGSKPRPMEVSRKEFKENFDKIFYKKKDSEVKKNKNTILPRKAT
tara:strand:+ start:1181 stop:1387 length:207 start_codon:yes stop_codon:yes gene_type:complete